MTTARACRQAVLKAVSKIQSNSKNVIHQDRLIVLSLLKFKFHSLDVIFNIRLNINKKNQDSG